jgi:hypothetical protein
VVDFVDNGLDVNLEALALAETLRAVELHDDAVTIESLAGARLDYALPVLAEILPRLFQTARA